MLLTQVKCSVTIILECTSFLNVKQEAFDNMPESLQGSWRGTESEDAQGSLESAIDALEEAIACLEEII